jgi:hypothetical protein
MAQPYDASFWRGRAAEARALAKAMMSPVARREMEQIAAAYMKLADRAERTAGLRHARTPLAMTDARRENKIGLRSLSTGKLTLQRCRET